MRGLLLAIVAAWRVALLGVFLKRSAGLNGLTLIVAMFSPIVLIIIMLFALNLDGVVFDLMRGGTQPPTVNDSAYQLLFMLTLLSIYAAPVLALGYVVACYVRWRHRRYSAASNPDRS